MFGMFRSMMNKLVVHAGGLQHLSRTALLTGNLRRTNGRPGEIEISQKDWRCIYRFPYIVHCRIFSKAKLYMTALNGIVVPAFVIPNAATIATADLLMVGGISAFSLLIMYGFGHMFRRLIGSVYLLAGDQNPDLVRISHLTFFGNRAERLVPRDQILFLSDANSNLNDLVLKVTLLKEKSYPLYICTKFGGIQDPKRFQEVFGIV